jgi:type II secretory pathway component GspD/PulD (secretin)
MFRASILVALCLSAAAPSVAASTPPGHISIDVRDLDIYDTVRLLATQAAVNVVVDSSVQHRPVTLRLQDVTFAKALSTLAESNDLAAATVGNVIYLGSIDVIGRRYADGTETGVQTRVFPLRNAAPDDVSHALSSSLSRGTIIVADRRTRSVVVTGNAATIVRAGEMVGALDHSSDIQVATIPMKFVRATDALAALKNALTVSPPSSLYAGEQQNAIVVTGTADFISAAEQMLSEVDRPGRQVRYDVRVTDITPQADSSNIGIVFGGADISGAQHAGSGSTVTTFLNSSLAINATLDLLVTKGRASILAQPSLSTLNNVPAALLVGQSYPIVYFDPRTGTQQVQFVNVGVNLHVTPTIGSDGSITTDLETDYSQFLSFVNNFPVIGTRKAESTLRVHDGQTIVIAGLFSDIDSATLTKVPFLSEIPLLGEIFKNRQTSRTKDEVVFLITPHLVTDAGVSNAP